MKQILIHNIRNVNLYVMNVMLKREKMLKTNNSLFEKKVIISHFANAVNLFK